MKKILSFVLMISMIVTSVTPAFANVATMDESLLEWDDIFVESIEVFAESIEVDLSALGLVGYDMQEKYLGTWDMGDGTNQTVTFVSNLDGSYTVFTYIDGILYDINTTVPGSGRIDTYIVEDGDRYAIKSHEIDIIDGVYGYVPIQAFTMRFLGLVRYTSSMGNISSITVDISSASRQGQARVSRGQTWESTGRFLSFLMGAFDFGAELGNTVFNQAFNNLLVRTFGGMVEAIVTTSVTGILTTEQIRGTPSQGTGGRTSWLPEYQSITMNSADGSLRSVRVAGTSVYGTSSWRTLHLARRLFQDVFRMDVTSSRIQWSN